LISDCDKSKLIGTKKRHKRKPQSITIKKKLEVIEWHKDNGKNACKTARHFPQYSRQSVSKWVAEEEVFRKLANNRSISVKSRRRVLKERKPKFPEVDLQVIQWFHSQREARLVVTKELIIAKALEVLYF